MKDFMLPLCSAVHPVNPSWFPSIKLQVLCKIYSVTMFFLFVLKHALFLPCDIAFLNNNARNKIGGEMLCLDWNQPLMIEALLIEFFFLIYISTILSASTSVIMVNVILWYKRPNSAPSLFISATSHIIASFCLCS